MHNWLTSNQHYEIDEHGDEDQLGEGGRTVGRRDSMEAVKAKL